MTYPYRVRCMFLFRSVTSKAELIGFSSGVSFFAQVQLVWWRWCLLSAGGCSLAFKIQSLPPNAIPHAKQIMYASIYTYTPEVYPTKFRTTAVGICSGISRFAGVLAPILTGIVIKAYV